MSIPIFQRSRTIVADDLDDLEHVNNVVWIRFMIELAIAHSDAVGLDHAAYRKIGGLWVVARHEIDYLRPASLEERITEETWISALRGPQSTRRYRFRRESDGRVLVQGLTEWAFVDSISHRPRRVLAGVRDRFVIVGDDPDQALDPSTTS